MNLTLIATPVLYYTQIKNLQLQPIEKLSCFFCMVVKGEALTLMICIVLYEKVSKEKSVERLKQGRKNNCWLKLWRYFREHGNTSE